MDFASVGGAEEGFEDMGLGGLTGTLNELDEGQVGEMVEEKRSFCGGPTDPLGGERTSRDGAQSSLIGGLMGHRDEQVKKGVFPDVLEEFAGPVFGIGKHQGTKRLGVKDVGGQLQEFGCGLSDGTGRGTGREADRLRRIGVEAKEGLGDFVSGMSVFVFMASHLAFAVAGESVWINDKQLAVEVATGAAQLSQGPLEVQSFGGAVRGAQVVDGCV